MTIYCRISKKWASPPGKKEIPSKDLDVGKGTEDKNSESFSLATQTPLSEEQRENTLNALCQAKEANAVCFRELKNLWRN
jgi:hypothetical protein